MPGVKQKSGGKRQGAGRPSGSQTASEFNMMAAWVPDFVHDFCHEKNRALKKQKLLALKVQIEKLSEQFRSEHHHGSHPKQ